MEENMASTFKKYLNTSPESLVVLCERVFGRRVLDKTLCGIGNVNDGETQDESKRW